MICRKPESPRIRPANAANAKAIFSECLRAKKVLYGPAGTAKVRWESRRDFDKARSLRDLMPGADYTANKLTIVRITNQRRRLFGRNFEAQGCLFATAQLHR